MNHDKVQQGQQRDTDHILLRPDREDDCHLHNGLMKRHRSIGIRTERHLLRVINCAGLHHTASSREFYIQSYQNYVFQLVEFASAALKGTTTPDPPHPSILSSSRRFT